MKPRFNLIKMDRTYVRNLRSFVKNTDIVENNGNSNASLSKDGLYSNLFLSKYGLQWNFNKMRRWFQDVVSSLINLYHRNAVYSTKRFHSIPACILSDRGAPIFDIYLLYLPIFQF